MEIYGDTCFFTICDESFFLGVVTLINSLVLTGHNYPIVVGDCGLTPEQRQMLRQYDQVRLFALDPSVVQNPTQYKAFAHLVGWQGTVVVIDSDMIVTGDLRPIIEKARNGLICAFPNPIPDRWFQQWQTIFELSQPPRHQTYVCACFLAVSTVHWPDFMARWWKACELIHSQPTYQEIGNWVAPTAQADQDALNAVLMSEYPERAVSLEPKNNQVYRWDFPFVQVTNLMKLSCRFRGETPVILHAALTPKPWQKSGARRDAYFKFMRRLLLGPDLAIRLPEGMLNLVTQPGASAYFRRHSYFLRNMGIGRFALSYVSPKIALFVKLTRDALAAKREAKTVR